MCFCDLKIGFVQIQIHSKNNILTPFRFGFRENNFTELAIITLVIDY